MSDDELERLRRENAELRERLAALEAQHVEELRRAHQAVAAARERAYWLDRWGIDLNAAMERPGARRALMVARRARGAARRVRAVARVATAPPRR